MSMGFGTSGGTQETGLCVRKADRKADRNRNETPNLSQHVSVSRESTMFCIFKIDFFLNLLLKICSCIALCRQSMIEVQQNRTLASLLCMTCSAATVNFFGRCLLLLPCTY